VNFLVNLLLNNLKIEDIQLIIFDKDGTLIDLYTYWSHMIRYRAEFICKEINLKATYVKKLMYAMGVDIEKKCIRTSGPVGIKKREIVMQAAVDYLASIGYKNTIELCIKSFEKADEYSLTKLDEIIKPINGYYNLINTLKNSNCKIAIASTDRTERVNLAMTFIKLNDSIDITVGSDRVKENKPSPDMVLYICKHLNISPSDTVMIGDAMTDIQMGINASLKASIGVCSGITPKKQLLNITPYVVDSISDIIVK
jgi:HAD superfamily hydrolase (TIGR01549 family)